MGNKAVQEALSGKVYYGCKAAAVLTNSYFTPQAKETAHKTGVELWDRDKLTAMVKKAYPGQIWIPKQKKAKPKQKPKKKANRRAGCLSWLLFWLSVIILLIAYFVPKTLALDGIGGCPLAGRDVDAIVAAGNGDIDAAEAVPFQHLGAEIFKIMAVHFVNILKADDSFHGQASLFSPTGIKQGRLPEQTALGNPITKRGISRFFPKNTH